MATLPDLRGYDSDYLHCRIDFHAWKSGNLVVEKYRSGKPVLVSRVKTCDRCAMERTELIKYPSGEIEWVHYKQPPGFKTKGIKTRTKAPYRAELVRRALAAQPRKRVKELARV